MRAWLLSAVLIAAGGVALLDCKGSAVCGDGKREEPEQCDNGLSNGAVGNNCSADCTLVGISRALLRVTVYRLRDEAPGYPGATCKDLGAAKVRLVVSGPDAKDEQYDCQSSLPAYDGITPGMYQVSATLLDDKGMPITKEIKSSMVDVKIGPETSLSLNFKPADFLKTYTGRLDFLPQWGAVGKACADAQPPLNMMTLKITKPGSATPIPGMANNGLKLDGSAGPCFVKDATYQYLRVDAIEWGHYDVYLNGLTGSNIHYCEKFDVFVGPSNANPTFDLVVDPASTDGGACP
jgi:hypothetical protein